ncbi:MAG TPA: winged helix-turn-helix domain-containing protein [Blastocatellia bacterium]|nr:winged helix-turn-helix domain-containing protein [Blastocatellia bacterium]
MTESGPQFYEFGPFRLDVTKQRLSRDGVPVPLTAKLFQTLLALIESNGELIEKETLIERVWPDRFVEEGNLTQNISVLRRLLGESPEARDYIVTVPRRGYRFVAEVKKITKAAAPTDEKMTATKPAAALSSAAPSVAVLPFKLLASDGDDYLGLGLADALITRLSNVRQIIVRPTSAVLKYAQVSQDVRVTGQELGVASVLEGSVRRAGGRLRVTVQLVRVEDGRALWADKFDEEFTDLFTVEDRIAERVTAALALQLTSAERALLAKRYTASPEAHEHYLKGRYYANRFTLDHFHKAIDAFNRALELDPDYALAYAGIAEAYFLAADLYLNPLEALQKTREAAARALQIDDSLPEAHTYLATVLMNIDWDWAEAERGFERAIEINPAYAAAHQWYGWLLILLARLDEAIRELEMARRLDPLSIGINWFLAAAYGFAGRMDEAAEQGEFLIELEPRSWIGHWIAGYAYGMLGQFDRSIAAFEQAGRLDQSLMIAGQMGFVYALAGMKDEARATLNEMKAKSAESYVPPYYIALIHAALGEEDEAFDYLEKAYEMRDGSLPLLKVDQRLDGLRHDPRFDDLVWRTGLPA